LTVSAHVLYIMFCQKQTKQLLLCLLQCKLYQNDESLILKFVW